MIRCLSALLRFTLRHAPAVPLEPEPRLRLVPGHYNRDRVAACLRHGRRQPAAEHRRGTA